MSLKSQVTGLNKFLTTVYGTEMRLSLILAQLGLKTHQIEFLRKYYLGHIVTSYVALLQEHIAKHPDGKRLYRIISRHFGLDGEPPGTLQTLGIELGISRERVRQLEKKAIRKCKAKSNKRKLEEGLRSIVLCFKGNLEATVCNHTVMNNQSQEIDDLALGGNSTSVTKVDNFKSYTVKKVRGKHRKAYENWTPEEDKSLEMKYKSGTHISELAVIFQRTQGAIHSRLKKLGVIGKST